MTNVTNPPPIIEVTAYKGLNQNLQCRGFQFEIGKTYDHEWNVEVCESGFHSCEYPLDVFSYYPPASSRFSVVKASGQLSRSKEGDSKIASASLTIEAEMSLPLLVGRAVDWVLGKLDASIAQTIVTGDRSAATNTGNQSAATNTGNQSAATNTGDRSAATNTGNQSAAEANGAESVAVSLGIKGRARSSITGAIVLCFRDANDGRLIHIRSSKVGDNGVKPNVWYSLNADGEFIEADSEE